MSGRQVGELDITVVVDLRIAPDQAVPALVKRLTAHQSTVSVRVVGLCRPLPFDHGSSSARHASIDVSAPFWSEVSRRHQRGDEDRLTQLRDSLEAAGFRPEAHLASLRLRQALQLVGRRWVADLALVASATGPIPTRVNGVRVERVPGLQPGGLVAPLTVGWS